MARPNPAPIPDEQHRSLRLAALEGDPSPGRLAALASHTRSEVIVVESWRSEGPLAPIEPQVLVRLDCSKALARCVSATGEGAALPCASDVATLELTIERAASRGTMPLLEGLDAAASTSSALATGACPRCLEDLRARLAVTYGTPERFTSPTLPEALAAETPAFFRDHLIACERRELALVRRAAAAARRRTREATGEGLVAIRATGSSPLLPALAQAADLLVLAGAGPFEGRLALELSAAARPHRARAQALSTSVTAELLREAYAAAALGWDVLVPADAEDEAIRALAVLRDFRCDLPEAGRTRADVCIVFDPRADRFTAGAHGRAAASAIAALARAGYAVAACARISQAPPDCALLLVEASALRARELSALMARIERGGKAAVIGPLGALDEEALPALEVPPLRPGATPLGRGTIYAFDDAGPISERALLASQALVPDAARFMRLSGRGELLMAVRDEPDGAAQLHLASLAVAQEGFVAPHGLVLRLGGSLREPRRVSFLAPGVHEELSVHASIRGTSVVLPALPPYAVLLIE